MDFCAPVKEIHYNASLSQRDAIIAIRILKSRLGKNSTIIKDTIYERSSKMRQVYVRREELRLQTENQSRYTTPNRALLCAMLI